MIIQYYWYAVSDMFMAFEEVCNAQFDTFIQCWQKNAVLGRCVLPHSAYKPYTSHECRNHLYDR